MRCKSNGLCLQWTLIATTVLGLATSAPRPAEQPENASDLREALSLDISGDGLRDPVECILKGRDRIEARDGKTGALLWSSRCYMSKWGETNRLGRLQAPFLIDVNDDGLPDLIFPAEGCGGKAIVALDRKSGSVLWRVPADDLPMQTSDVGGAWGGDLVLFGGRILVASRNTAASKGTPDKQAGGVVALSPRNGAVLWRSAAPIRAIWEDSFQRSFEGVRTQSPESTSVSFEKVREMGVQSEYASGIYNPITRQFEGGFSPKTHPLPSLTRLADSVSHVITGPALLVAGGGLVQALRLDDGAGIWNWKVPRYRANEVVRPILLSRDSGIVYFGWLNPGGGSAPFSAVVASLDASSGATRWLRQFDLPLVETGWTQAHASVSLTVSDRVTIDYTSHNESTHPLKKNTNPSRVIVLDLGTGKDVPNDLPREPDN